MGTLRIVGRQPGLRLGANLRERGEDVRVEDFAAIRAIEAFDVRVLIGFTGLEVLQPYAMSFAPGRQRVGEQFGAVVTTDRARRAVDRE